MRRPPGRTGEAAALQAVRLMADRAFSRAAGAPLIGGNRVRLLADARENYPAWLAAIGAARSSIHLENYIIRSDEAGEMFAEPLMARARDGVRVRVIYDWLGNFRRTSRSFWNRLREAGVEVRCYNPPRMDSPLGWLSRDHRKMLTVDGVVGFVTGLCIGREWLGDPAKGREPWRDTGVEVRGPAVAEIERAFGEIWGMLGEPPAEADLARLEDIAPVGDVGMRIVANVPATAGLFRLDQLVAALARERLWLTDAYYAGTSPYVQSLRAAAQDGVDVRLLVPSATDLPVLKPLSRAGYRALLEAGVRVFEWNGTMLHAKTAVADGHWARVGSTNLNLASWLGNCELDAVIEDVAFAREMEEMYLRDLGNATEIALGARRRLRSSGGGGQARRAGPGSGGGSGGRAVAGAIRIGSSVGAAVTGRRPIAPVESRTMLVGGVLALGLAALVAFLPKVLAYPVAALLLWVGIILSFQGGRLVLQRRRRRPQGIDGHGGEGG